jgi:cytochrome c2
VLERLKTLGAPVLVAVALLIGVTLIFVFEFFSYSPASSIEATVPADSYVGVVAGLLANADSEHGETLLTTYGCAACHRAGAENHVAPSFVGIAQRAGERRPPLSAEEYLYESIVHPSAYIVEEYPNAMPQNFAERISNQDLGDLIAYLLTPDAH